jgi:hypothetical protein
MALEESILYSFIANSVAFLFDFILNSFTKRALKKGYKISFLELRDFIIIKVYYSQGESIRLPLSIDFFCMSLLAVRL